MTSGATEIQLSLDRRSAALLRLLDAVEPVELLQELAELRKGLGERDAEIRRAGRCLSRLVEHAHELRERVGVTLQGWPAAIADAEKMLERFEERGWL